MSKRVVQSTQAVRIPSREGVARAGFQMWTRAALFIAIALVVARLTLLESIREASNAMPGAAAVRGPGPGTAMVLDLFAFLPAILVIVRRLRDEKFVLRFEWSPVLFAALAGWSMISVAWSADKFVALVGSFHVLSAAALLWAFAQCVTGWRELRLLAGICFGLLLVFAAQGMMHHFVDVPDTIREWEKQRLDFFKAQGWEPDSFIARQFDHRVRGGELFGFFSSPNTFAAMIVIAMLISIGSIVQRLADKDEIVWPVLLMIVMPLGLWMMYLTNSRAAQATLVLGGMMLVAMRLLRPLTTNHQAKFYWTAVVSFFLGVAAIVGHGAYHGTLFHDSLNFRWRYWVGSFAVFKQHVLAGVGWNNFGPAYLVTRLPAASEEIKDPHNFLMRVATELGAIGLVLVIAWMLRAWWEMTQPRLPLTTEVTSPTNRKRFAGVGFVAAVCAVAIMISAIGAIDWSQYSGYVIFECFKRAAYFACLFIGTIIVTIRSSSEERLDDRSAVWILTAIVIAIGCFLIHCLIDFALFEPGPLYLVAMLVGAALGMRSVARERKVSRQWVRRVLTILVFAWIAVGVFVVGPVVAADESANRAEDEMTAKPPAFSAAMDHFNEAHETVPYNYEYPLGAARAMESLGFAREAIRAAYDDAIRIDPMLGTLYIQRADFELRQPRPDIAAVQGDYRRALLLNPNDVSTRIAYAEILERYKIYEEAYLQYIGAMEKNGELPIEEPKRLPKEKVDEIWKRIEQLKAKK